MKHIRKYWLGLIVFGSLSLAAIASSGSVEPITFPTPLVAYGDAELIKSGEIMAVLTKRVDHTPFNLWASLIFLFAILHTFFAAKILVIAKKLEQKNADKMRADGRSEEEIEHNPPFLAEILHFFGEVEAIFGIWVLALAAVTISFYDWGTFKNYMAHSVNFTEPM
ncbi:MAG: putative Na+/H+ antiporter, partial [SAR324 cluster bacterium]|nr:putative Na+/H+ antiporter [SAR324 cluster bacterium]